MSEGAYPAPGQIVAHFAPGWFAAVMGTGVLAQTAHTLAAHWSPLDDLALALHGFNTLLFLCLAPLWLARWLRFPAAALEMLKHPVQASFYPTFSIALIVLSGQWRVFTPQPEIALALWWAGSLLTLAFSFAILFFVFSGEAVTVDHVTPAKFIPSVGLVVIPLGGAPLLPLMSGAARDLALLLNVVGLGAGTLMYVGLLGMTLQRKYLHRPIAAPLVPTIWIHLAPVGVIPVSLYQLLEQLPFPALHELAVAVMLLVWGYGVWWLVMAGLLTLAARRAGELPFALSWWGFTFPLGAFVAEGLKLAELTGLGGLLPFSAAVWCLLLGLWSATLWQTLAGVWRGTVWLPPR